MPVPSKNYTFSSGGAIVAAEVNADFDELYSTLDPGSSGLDSTNFAAAQAWQTVALGTAAWTTNANLSYMKDHLGFVHFKGDAHTAPSSYAANTTIATLPSGYRPDHTLYGLLVPTTIAGSVLVSVDSSGLVKNITALVSGVAYSFGIMAPFRAA